MQLNSACLLLSQIGVVTCERNTLNLVVDAKTANLTIFKWSVWSQTAKLNDHQYTMYMYSWLYGILGLSANPRRKVVATGITMS